LFKRNYPTYDADFSLLPVPARMGANPAYSGRGVTMAFIDSGFFPHPDLGERVICHADATSNRIIEGRRFYEAADYAWHGQMTSVIAAGDGRTSNGRYRGIASGANLVLVKVSSRKRRIKEPDILRGIEWLVANHRRFNVRILNISVGGDYENHDPYYALYRAVQRLTEEGVVVLVAAGNSGEPILVPPASAPHAITIGGYNDQNATDPALWLPYANNYGHAYDGSHKPDVIAPAAWVPSPIMPNTPEAREAHWLAQLVDASDEAEIKRLIWAAHQDLGLLPASAKQPDAGVYQTVQERINKHKIIDAHHQHVDGTSVSTPIVASVVAQLLEIEPRLTPTQIRAMLVATAQPIPNRPAVTQGAGRVDAAKAVATLLQAKHITAQP
jgi:serine protease AprX